MASRAAVIHRALARVGAAAASPPRSLPGRRCRPRFAPTMARPRSAPFSSAAQEAPAPAPAATADDGAPHGADGADAAPSAPAPEPPHRTKLADVRVSEVLRAKHSYRWVEPVIPRSATVREAITTAIDGGLSAMMVLEEDGTRHVAGLLTSRDVLRIMAAAIRDGEPDHAVLRRAVGDHMTPISQVVFGRPDETVGMLRAIMSKLGIKCIPILSRQGRVEGVLTARDINDFAVSATEKGGKKQYLKDISERVGLGSSTSMAEPPTYLKAALAQDHQPLFVSIGHAELPHPFKTAGGSSDPDVRNGAYSTNSDLSEDASFVATVTLPVSKGGPTQQFTYLGVADGVGSWREYGVDPREFSHTLMQECRNVLAEANAGERHHNDAKEANHHETIMIPPAMLMAQAYDRVKAQNIIGSCTACIALFDSVRHQLHFSNLGDSGLILLRHIDSDVAGSLKRDRLTPRTERQSDLQISFVSQQQLRSFNHPYQLGWTGEEIDEHESTSFKSAKASCNTSLHVRRGDILIMATDGLFDNVDLDEICAIVLAWEERHGFVRQGDVLARERRWSMGNSLTVLSAESIHELAEELCQRARENSLNKDIDSPFAILAKENDIMWSGGMPDDCTVMALHVVGRDPDDVMDQTYQ